jgi:RNA polymerase sigma-70 factor (ECF subfamily)
MSSRGAHDFPTTSWSLIRKTAHLQTPEARAALASLCQTYWDPLYAFLRRSGRSREDAEDLVQGFFAQLLEANRLEQLTPERGSFRGFLLVALKNFVSTDTAKGHAKKRGGGHFHLPFQLDLNAGDSRYLSESVAERTPDEAYERRWALTLLSNVLDRLRVERDEAGDHAVFRALEGYLPGGLQQDSYETVASKLSMTSGAIKVAVHRLRARYRELLRAEIAALVNDPADVDEELRYLHGVVSR